MKIIKKIIFIALIGGIIAVFYELLWKCQGDFFKTRELSIIIGVILEAFIEGFFLFLILVWKNRLRFNSSLKCYLVYVVLLILYYYIRQITVTISLFMGGGLLSALFIMLIIKLTGLELSEMLLPEGSTKIISSFFDVIIDVALLLLIFYPLLTLINKWMLKKENKNSDKVEELVDIRK